MAISHGGILTEYLEAAMNQLKLERLSDTEVYAEIPSCPGVWATGENEGQARQQIREVLEEWLLLKIRGQEPIPNVNGHGLLFECRPQ